jgi:hypothetical protein
MLNPIIRSAAIVVAFIPPAHAGKVFACDLVSPGTASVVLGSGISRQYPNRETQKLGGGVKLSTCLFFARKDRDSLTVHLIEYPSVKDAEKAFAENSRSTTEVQHVPVSGLGDAASWWNIAVADYGLQVRKGRQVLMLQTTWRDSITGAGLRERLTTVAGEALKKLQASGA